MYSAQVLPVTFVEEKPALGRSIASTAVSGENDSARRAWRCFEGAQAGASGPLRGVASHARYVERHEKTQLDALSPPLGRPEATAPR